MAATNTTTLEGIVATIKGLKRKLYAWPIVILGINASGDPVPVKVADDGTLPVGLPTGAATAAKQDTQITAEQAILAKLSADPATQTTLAAVLAAQTALVTAPSKYREPAQNSTKAAVKASAGNLHGYMFYNTNTYPVFVKLYASLAAGVTVGVTVPARTIPVPTGPYVLSQENTGIPLTAFAAGITVAITKFAADDDATALDSDIIAEIYYK